MRRREYGSDCREAPAATLRNLQQSAGAKLAESDRPFRQRPLAPLGLHAIGRDRRAFGAGMSRGGHPNQGTL